MLSTPFHKHTIQHTPYFIYFSFGIFIVKARAERKRRAKDKAHVYWGVSEDKNSTPNFDSITLSHGMIQGTSGNNWENSKLGKTA